MSNSINKQRRKFTINTLKMAALSPLAGIVVSGEALAQADLPHVKIDDPVAKALKYVHDANEAERPDKQGVPGTEQVCSNCQFIQGDEGAEWRPCMLFPGKSVNNKGWCNSWTKKV